MYLRSDSGGIQQILSSRMARQGSAMITLSPSLQAPRWLQRSVGECTIFSFRCPTEPMRHNTFISSRPMLLSQPVHVCKVQSKFDGGSRIRPQDIPSLRSGNDNTINAQVGDSYLSPSERRKMDEHDDSRFYERPRFVEHSDDDFLYRLRSLYTSPQEMFEVSGPFEL